MTRDDVLYCAGFVLAGFLAVACAHRPDLTVAGDVACSVAGSSLWAISVRLLRRGS